ncbi:hypothetical protein Rsub_11357 [Raphidocelis subcapitata]|uniref:MAGE domain-containing protein n=1 Tax=Raphidocelis subcapitata TaxID=307507 RepID=A0A2V0PNQ3_9CHLO|nr:hypothetical protein Rsub_11357 [Raphidocelis subcapitata]|eukprot:GBF98775.1 hypothetical protein Rsub_11357 [Raphidocelis subcapitata]
MSARAKRKAGRGGRAEDDAGDEEFFSAEEQAGSEDDEPSDDGEDQAAKRRQAKRARVGPAKTPRVKPEPGMPPPSAPRGRGGTGAAAGGNGGGEARRRGETDAGVGPGSEAAAAAAAAAVGRIPIGRGEIARMNAKIQEYQEAAAEAETKLASLLSLTEYQALVASVVRTMLFKQHEKPGVPVKRQDLLEAFTGTYKGHAHAKKLPSLVLRVAQAQIISTLGIEMQEVTRVAASTGRKKNAMEEAQSTTATYVLRSVLPVGVRRALVDDPADDQAQAFKMVVLALIHLNGGQIEVDEFWRHMHMLGVEPEDRDHPHFGRPEDCLKELEKTRHIVRLQQSGAAGAVQVLEWGEHASSEVGEEGIKRWIEQEFAAAPGFGGGAGGGGGGAGGAGGAGGSGAGGSGAGGSGAGGSGAGGSRRGNGGGGA